MSVHIIIIIIRRLIMHAMSEYMSSYQCQSNCQTFGSLFLFLVIKFKTWAKAQSDIAVPVSSRSLSSVELSSSQSKRVSISITEETDNFIAGTETLSVSDG